MTRSASGHIQLPNDFDEGERWLTLGDEARLLFVDVLTSTARRLTDGHLSPSALAKLRPAWPARRRLRVLDDLIAAGVLAAVVDGWIIQEWGMYALTRAEVEQYRASRQAGAVAGGRARAVAAAAGGRRLDGTFTPATEPATMARDDQPSDQPSPPAASQPHDHAHDHDHDQEGSSSRPVIVEGVPTHVDGGLDIPWGWEGTPAAKLARRPLAPGDR